MNCEECKGVQKLCHSGVKCAFEVGLIGTLTQVTQLLDGWKQTEPTAWSKWDQDVRRAVGVALAELHKRSGWL